MLKLTSFRLIKHQFGHFKMCYCGLKKNTTQLGTLFDAEIPRTLSSKKQELPIKKLLLGQPIEKVVNRDAMANPGYLEWYAGFAAERAEKAQH